MKLLSKNTTLLNYQLLSVLTNDNLEFEVLFPEYDDEKLYYKQHISMDIFRDTITRLKDLGLQMIPGTENGQEQLDISIYNNNLRMTVEGVDDIQTFCKTNRLTDENCRTRTYKERYSFPEDHRKILEDKGIRDTRPRFDSELWKFRANLKKEYTYGSETPLSNIDPELEQRITKDEMSFLDYFKFKKEMKYFRYKKRYSFYTPMRNFRIDLTIVKESQKKYARTLHESGALENDAKYEIEIEYIGRKYDMTELYLNESSSKMRKTSSIISNAAETKKRINFKKGGIIHKIKSDLVSNIGRIIQIIQGSYYIINTEEELFVKTLYNIKYSNELSKLLSDTKYNINQIIEILEKSSSRIFDKLKQHEIDGIFTDRRNYHITEFYKAIKETVYGQSYNEAVFNSDLEKDANFIKVLNEKMRNTLALLDKRYRNGVYVKNKFVGPKPITLEMSNLDMNHIHSILYDYTVTDKADGMGNLLFVAGTDMIEASSRDGRDMGKKLQTKREFTRNIQMILKKNDAGIEKFISKYSDISRGHIYRIDQNMKISYSGCNIRVRDVRDNRANKCSLLNGEWITKDRTGKTIHKFMVYDCYLHYGMLINHYMLTKNADRPTMYDSKTNGSRLLMAEDLIQTINEQNSDVLFDLELKEFKEANEITRNIAEDRPISELDIFKLSKELWNQYTSGSTTASVIPYKLDGLIYTPQEKPVGWTPISTNQLSSITFPLYAFQTGVRWDSNMKWKPVEDNSIDLLVHFAKDVDSSTGIKSHKIIERSTGRYKEVHLYCGKQNSNRKYVAMPFIPIAPYDETAYVAYLPINTNGHILTTQDKIPIEDDTIVEFTYIGLDEKNIEEYKAEKQMRWTPLRIRNDKTYDYKKAKRDKKKKLNTIRSMIFDNNTIFKMLKTYSKDMGITQELINKGMNIQNGLKNREMVMDVLQNIVFEMTRNRDLLEKLERNEDYIKRNNRGLYKKNKDRINDLIYICKNNFQHYVKKSTSTSIKFDLYYKPSPDSIRSIFAEFLLSLQVEQNVDILINFEEEIYVRSAYGNDFKTAVNNWRNIHFPITEDMIFEGTGIISQEEYYYKVDLSKKRNECPSIRIRNFHNYVKRKLFDESVKFLRKDNPKAHIRLMELACGKGQDLFKWIENDVSLVFGVDINVDNIENKVNGAQIRYINSRDKQYGEKMTPEHKLPDVYFAIGDVSRNIRNYDAFHTDSGKEKIYVPIVKDSVMDGKYDVVNQKFNLISMQFAVHYMFDKKERLDGLINNIDENLSLGGLFIGTCFDGSMVWEKLKDMVKGEFISESDGNGNLKWKVVKNYVNRTRENKMKEQEDYFPDDDDSLNHPINVYISSINSYIDEYLVNMKYFVKEMAKRNIRLLNEKDRNEWISSDTFEHYHKIYTKKHRGLGEREKVWSFLNRTFVFCKYNTAEVEIWESIKRRIFDEKRIRNIMEGNEEGVKTFVMDNYLNDPLLDKKKILAYIMRKLTQERSTLFNLEEEEFKNKKKSDGGGGVEKSVKKDLAKIDEDIVSGLDGISSVEKENEVVDTGGGDEGEKGNISPLLTGTAATQLNPDVANSEELREVEHEQHVKKIRECLIMLGSDTVFGLYNKFLRKKPLNAKQKSIVSWEYVNENFPAENAEECLKILKTAAKDVQLYELYHIDLLNIKIFYDLLDDYKRRKNDSDLQTIDPKAKKQYSKDNEYNIYMRANSVLQQCVVDYVSRIARGKFDFNPLHITVFKDEHTVYKYPEIRSIDETSKELIERVSGILELLKKDENDDINYNDTVFAKIIQIYGGGDKIVEFMQILKKLLKRAKKNKKITLYPPVYIELYEYIIGRFLKRYNKETVGKVLVGGKLANADFTKVFNDIKSFDLFSEVNSNNFDEEAFEFMQKSHKNYLKFKQSGGTMNLKNLMFLKDNGNMATQCEKYAKNDPHPVCNQFLKDMNEFKTYLKQRLRK